VGLIDSRPTTAATTAAATPAATACSHAAAGDRGRGRRATIGSYDFARLDLRVATRTRANWWRAPNKLLRLTLDLGGEQRTVFPASAPPIAEQLTDRLVVVIANLAPRKMRFGVSPRHGAVRG